MNKTSLYNRHLALGANMVEFAGFSMPVSYSSIIKEHTTVREGSGIFDISHMGQIFIRGAESKQFIDTIFPSRTSKLSNGMIQYSLLLNESGGIIDDLLIYQISENENYLLLVNAANIEKDYNFLLAINEKFTFKVDIVNESANYSMLAIQGPDAVATTLKIFPETAGLKYYQFKYQSFNNQDILISKTGYTGEEGFEFISDSDTILKLWDQFISLKVLPIGLGARDSLRLECCFSLYGHELCEKRNPFQSGVGFLMDRNKTNHYAFSQISKQPEDDMVKAFIVDGKGIARAGDKIYINDKEAGVVSSGSYLPSLKCSGGLLVLNQFYPADNFIVKIRNKPVKIKLMNKPLVLPFNRRP